MELNIKDHTGNFAENKDTAKYLRVNQISQSIEKKEIVILNFKGVDSTTQSFVHALISDIFQKYGEEALKFFEFKNCNKPVKSLITTVINYSME